MNDLCIYKALLLNENIKAGQIHTITPGRATDQATNQFAAGVLECKNDYFALVQAFNEMTCTAGKLSLVLQKTD